MRYICNDKTFMSGYTFLADSLLQSLDVNAASMAEQIPKPSF